MRSNWLLLLLLQLLLPLLPLLLPTSVPSVARLLATALSSEAASAEDNAERVKKRGKYTQWFDSPFLPAILKAYREQGGSARKTVAFLRSTDPSGTLYERLSHSTISSWFDNGKLLQRFQQQYDEGVAAARYGGPSSAFTGAASRACKTT